MILSTYQKNTLRRAARILENQIREGEAFSNPDTVATYLKTQLGAEECEKFAVMFLDNRHRLICFEVMFTGTIDSASVYPREVAKRALEHNAAAVIFAHNHPSGMCEPSDADIRITKKLKAGLELFDIRTLDHMVVGASDHTSMAERGLM